jgi:hypothetical protein
MPGPLVRIVAAHLLALLDGRPPFTTIELAITRQP